MGIRVRHSARGVKGPGRRGNLDVALTQSIYNVPLQELLIEMYGRRVRASGENITQESWGTKCPPGTIANPDKRVYEHIEVWRNRPIEQEQPYVYLYGLVLTRSGAGEVKYVSVQVAIGRGR